MNPNCNSSKNNGNGPLPTSSRPDDSIYYQVWNMINAREKKSTDAGMGSATNMLDVMTELDIMDKKLINNGPIMKPMLINKRLSGMNCVLGENELEIGNLVKPQPEKLMSRAHAEFVGEVSPIRSLLPSEESNAGILPQFKVPHYDHSLNQLQSFRGNLAKYRSESRFRTPSKPNLVANPSKAPSPSMSPTRNLEKHSLATPASPAGLETKPVSWQPVKATEGDFSSNYAGNEENPSNNVLNRNNININLTFAMGQYQNGGKTETPPFFDVQELKPPRVRTNARKPKTETSIQTDSDSLSDLSSTAVSYDNGSGFQAESTSTFPSVTPSRHNCQGQREGEQAMCIPQTQTLSLSEYIDLPAVVAYTGESVKSFIQTADHIINNYIIIPDDNYYTDDELDAGEGKIGISLMRLLGVPLQLRHSIYNEALHNVQAFQEISVETVSVINHVIDWLCDGDGDGKQKLIHRLRRIASVTTDFQPDSEGWTQFETEFGVFTDTVSEVMKQGYEVGKEVARRCSETILDKLAHATNSNTLALMANSKASGESSSVLELSGSTSRKASVASVRQSLPAINEEEQVNNNEFDLESERNKVLVASPLTWTRDAFLDAPVPESENTLTKAFNTVCQSITNSFLSKTQNVLNSLQGTAQTPILGESQCISRDEQVTLGQTMDTLQVDKDLNGNESQIEYLTAEIQKLAALTDSYFIEPRDEEEENPPEPEEQCPPPPVPKRVPSKCSKTIMSINLERDIPLPDFAVEVHTSSNKQYDITSGTEGHVTSQRLTDTFRPGNPSSYQDLTNNYDDDTERSQLLDFYPNVNQSDEMGENLPKIVGLVENLQKFWPNQALSMILTPEAQLQYAMNNYFDANGNKAEVQMSVAALKVLAKSSDSETTEKMKRPPSAETVQNDTERLERMIQELRAEVQQHQRPKSGVSVKSRPKPEVSKSLDLPGSNEIPVPLPKPSVFVTPAVIPAEVVLPSATIRPPTREVQVDEVNQPKLVTVSEELPPKLDIITDEEFQRMTGYQENLTNSFVVTNGSGPKPNTPVRPKTVGVSPRLARIPPRLLNPENWSPLTSPKKSPGNSTRPKPKPFVFGKPGVPSPPQRSPRPKIKVIDTVPFPQPKVNSSSGKRPQSQPPRVHGHVAIGGSYAHGNQSTVQSTASRVNLSRTNSYRQLFQIRRLVCGAQAQNGPVYAQSPNSSGTGSNTQIQIGVGGQPVSGPAVDDVIPNTQQPFASLPQYDSDNFLPNSKPRSPTKKPAFYPF